MSQTSDDPPRADQLEGRYANAFQVGHNAFEFLFDFGQVPPDSDQARFHTRIITAPAYAKAFFETLKDSLERYEQSYGVIG
jgi:hypothetical protein